jgi:threonyl-tRNA synthetase
MPVITLPDGSQRNFDASISVHDVAADIGAGLAKAALAGVVDGREVDTSYVINGDVSLSIVTDRDDAAIEIIRHSTAHLLAQAVQQLFPGTQVTIGPTVEDGFYYDFASGHNFTLEDLDKIEARMVELAADDLSVERIVAPRDKAIEIFRNMGEHYKVQIIEDLPEDEEISIYRQGEWMDLCRGPHVPSTGKLQAFKLTKVAGAYWRGDANNQQLQRIYGTAWPNKKQLKAYLNRIAEAEKRDHRKIAKKLNLFHTQEEAPGMVFWHPAGWTIYQTIERYMREKQHAYDYKRSKRLRLWI